MVLFSFYQAKAKDEFGEEVTLYKWVDKFRSDSATYLTVTADEYEVEVMFLCLMVMLLLCCLYYSCLLYLNTMPHLGWDGNNM